MNGGVYNNMSGILNRKLQLCSSVKAVWVVNYIFLLTLYIIMCAFLVLNSELRAEVNCHHHISLNN